MSIRIYYDQIKFRIRNLKEVKRFLDKVIRDEERVPGDLLFILSDDESVLNINREFLKHDSYTDVIAFDNSVGEVVNGEIYISIDTVRKNAREYGCSIMEETVRVMIHGLLHLCGYDDIQEKDRKIMLMKQELLVEQIIDRLQ
ncbi:MAG: rRNA maturation RNase YbeY [Bacteroidales bacterium]|nr:rRNA maturation RNase YbeY [Bacteroidales bacterium]MBP7037892.1 rRNA maturation RNase YbeY [Bacteroidales bacterium]MDI9553648.1 rRNA maturation RNase YbeY [Bacteroidota bacterium]NLK55757.1 rRNA maturation RNase YbeY [Bacteroidales bacterium]